jgi:hypothetical protein
MISTSLVKSDCSLAVSYMFVLLVIYSGFIRINPLYIIRFPLHLPICATMVPTTKNCLACSDNDGYQWIINIARWMKVHLDFTCIEVSSLLWCCQLEL